MDRYLFLQRSFTINAHRGTDGVFLAHQFLRMRYISTTSCTSLFGRHRALTHRLQPAARKRNQTRPDCRGGRFTFVRVVYTDSEGKSVEGFIHQQYLSKERVAADQLSDLANEKAAIAAEVQQLREDFSTLDAAYAQLASAMSKIWRGCQLPRRKRSG